MMMMLLLERGTALRTVTRARGLVAGTVLRHMATKNSANSRDQDESKLDTKLKTGRPPRSLQDPSRFLRRTSVPSFKQPPSYSRESLDQILAKCLKVKPCTTVTTGEKYDLQECIQLLNARGLQPNNLIPDEIVTFKYQCDGYRGDVMVLSQNASIVCWGFDEAFVKGNIVPMIASARINPLLAESFESEDMDYVEIETEEELRRVQAELAASSSNSANMAKNGEASFLAGDLIVVSSIDPATGLLDKAAFSSGLARSTKLAVLEESMENHISKTRIITEKISRGVKLNLNESDALRSIGRLFLIRGKLNLYSELIETPDLYWSEPQLERIFKQTSKYLDIGPRISILNTKLDYSTDECRALMGVLNERKSAFLEWIIIYLITLEIVFELYHFYERYWLDRKDKNIKI